MDGRWAHPPERLERRIHHEAVVTGRFAGRTAAAFRGGAPPNGAHMKKRMLQILGGGLLLLAAATLLWDIVAPDVPAGTPPAREGFRVGAVVGVGLRTLILGGLGWMLLMAPDRPGRATSPKERMRRILAAHGHQVPAARPENGDLYSNASDDDLLVVYEHIDPQANPERFAALLWTVSRRMSNHSSDAGAAR